MSFLISDINTSVMICVAAGNFSLTLQSSYINLLGQAHTTLSLIISSLKQIQLLK